MTVSASTQIPKPSDPAVFQRQCKILFERVLKDPGVKEFGTSGQAQHGIDLLGRRKDVALDHWVGIQCKLTIKSEKLPKGTVRKEAQAALGIEPKLKELIIATTAAEDAVLDQEAAAFTDEQAKLGRDFTVLVWGWGTLETEILQHEEAIRAFHPDAFPHMNRLMEGQERLSEQVSAGRDHLAAQLHEVNITLQVIRAQTAGLSTQDESSANTVLDRQIDHYRDLLNNGQFTVAQELLEKLWDTLPSGATGRIRFRIRANIAACKLQSGRDTEAGQLYLEACDYAPDQPRAPAFKVLGLILLGRPREAFELGVSMIDSAGDTGPLVGHIIMAAKHLSDVEDSFAIIPAGLDDDPFVAFAKIDFLRTRHDDGSWWEIAASAHARHPDDENLARCNADAVIDQACRWAAENNRGMLPHDLHDAVKGAAKTLREQFDRNLARAKTGTAADISLAVNLSTAWRLLRNFDEARAAIQQGLEIAPENDILRASRAAIALESGNTEEAADALQDLPKSRDLVFGQLQLFANRGDWLSLVALAEDTDLSHYSGPDQAFFEALVLLARIRLDARASPKDDVDALLAKHPDEAIVPIVLYEVAASQNDPEWSAALFNEARRRPNLTFPARLMLSRIAEREGDAEAVIQLLDGHIPLDSDTEELRCLARAFVNAPPREAAVAFAAALPESLKNTAFFTRVIASIDYNRGALTEAEEAFRSAIVRDPTDLHAHIGLINTLMRLDRRADVEAHVKSLDLASVEGPAMFKMGLAQLLVHFGEVNKGLAYGYETALTNRDDPRTALLYIGLILPDPTGLRVPAVGDRIAEDCSIDLERDDATRMRVTIEAGPDRPSIDHYSPGHAFAKQLIGARKDDVIVYEPAGGSAQRWRILGFKHKYLALLHDIMETFAARFPESGGFYAVELQDDDVTPILDQIRAKSEADAQIVEKYVSEGYPLSLVAKLLGRTPIDTAAHILRHGHPIKTCIGTEGEREAAANAALLGREKGVVLDAYTAWCAHSFGLLSTLKSLFPRVVLPRSALDEFRIWRQDYEDHADQPVMTMSYAHGQYFRQEVTPEESRQVINAINEVIDSLEAGLEILPAVAPGTPSELETAFLEVSRDGSLDSVYLAASQDLVLLSEDMHYRNLARQLYQRDGFWLQIALMAAIDADVIDLGEYARTVAEIAIQKHDYVALNDAVLTAIVENDPDDTMPRLRAALEFIGTASADVPSHTKVGWHFLFRLWRRVRLSNHRKQRASGMMLERLVTMLSQHQDVAAVLKDMIEGSKHRRDLQRYIEGWARGHFIPL